MSKGKLMLFGLEHDPMTPCPSCVAIERRIRRETILPLPKGPGMAPLSRNRKLGFDKVCFDCAVAEQLMAKGMTFPMARVATGNDRQEKLRWPGYRGGIPGAKASSSGDLERLLLWQADYGIVKIGWGCDSLRLERPGD